MRINDQQIELIEKEIFNSSLKSKELKDDLLDHFCCAVEIYLAKGKSFEAAFEKAKMDISPDGIDEIQRETVYLLNYKRMKNLKKLMFASGLIFSMLLSIGLLLKLMNWPAGFYALMIGTLGLGFVFLPLLTINQLKLKANQILSEKAKYFLGLSSGLIFTTSVIFKQLHLMGASVLLVLSIFIFTFGFLPFVFFRLYKKSVV